VTHTNEESNDDVVLPSIINMYQKEKKYVTTLRIATKIEGTMLQDFYPEKMLQNHNQKMSLAKCIIQRMFDDEKKDQNILFNLFSSDLEAQFKFQV
jgi:hypothetical protein